MDLTRVTLIEMLKRYTCVPSKTSSKRYYNHRNIDIQLVYLCVGNREKYRYGFHIKMEYSKKKMP